MSDWCASLPEVDCINLVVSEEDYEVVWAEPVGTGRARLLNVPFCDRLNYGDLVEVTPHPEGAMPRAGLRIERMYPGKAIIFYRDDWHAAWPILEKDGCIVEWGNSSCILVAHPADVDPIELLTKAGLEARPCTEEDLD